MKTPTPIGQRILDTRVKRGLTREKCAEALEESPATVRGWEKGHYEPRPDKMEKILRWLANGGGR